MLVQFNSQTDYKIKQCVMDPTLPIERVCGAGADPDLDQLISALAHITRRKPKPLVDTIMLWRIQKRDGPQAAQDVSVSSLLGRKMFAISNVLTIVPFARLRRLTRLREAASLAMEAREVILMKNPRLSTGRPLRRI